MKYEELKKLREQLIRKYNSISKSMKARYIYDIYAFNGLVESLGFNDLTINYKIKKDFKTLENFFEFKIYENMEYLEQIADTIIYMYKDMEFEYFGRRACINLSIKDKTDLFREFMSYFCPKAIPLYNELFTTKHISFCHLDATCGESVSLRNFDQHFLLLNGEEHNDITELETYFHELMHIYVEKFLANYRWEISNLIEGFYLEAIPLYAEREFYDFLREKKIFGNEIDYQANFADYLLLRWFKVIKYLSEMDKRPENTILFSNFEYEVLGNTELDIDKGTLYGFPSTYKEGYTYNIRYAVSSIDAFKIFEQRKNGEKDVIDKYILSLLNKDKFYEDICGVYDLTFMRNKILESVENLKKKRSFLK